jgi:hypothetical protein
MFCQQVHCCKITLSTYIGQTWKKSAPLQTSFTEVDERVNVFVNSLFKPLNAELNPICHLLALLGAHHILHISRIRVNQTASPHSKQYFFFQFSFLRTANMLMKPPCCLFLPCVCPSVRHL